MKQKIYVIGFPKSGNTWLARLMAEITNSNIHANSNKDYLHLADNSFKRNGDFIIYKEHAVDDIELVLKEKVIYIVRDVRDVIISGFFHSHRKINENLILNNKIMNKYFEYEIRGLNNKWQGNFLNRMYLRFVIFVKFLLNKKKLVEFGGWSDHVEYWMQWKEVCFVRYEDLLDDTKGEITRIVSELDLNIDENIIDKAIQNQSFDKKKETFLQQGDIKNLEFLRNGKKESWKRLLSNEMYKEIITKHSKIMKQFNYIK